MLIICQVGNKPTQTEELKVEKKAITAFSLYFLLQYVYFDVIKINPIVIECNSVGRKYAASR